MDQLLQLQSTSAVPSKRIVAGVCTYASGCTITNCTNDLTLEKVGGSSLSGVHSV